MSNASSTTRVVGGALVTLLIATYSCSASCPSRESSLPLDLDQFDGNWYVADTTLGETDLGEKTCTRFSVKKTSSDSFNTVYTVQDIESAGRHITLIGNGTLEDDIKASYFFKEKDVQMSPMIHRVIAANYSSYVMIFVCGIDHEISPWGMLLSKDNPHPSRDVVREFRKKVEPYLAPREIPPVYVSHC